MTPVRANRERSLRILHHLDDFRFETGGVCKAVLDLSLLMAAQGHSVTVATENDQDVPHQWKEGRPDLPRAVRLVRPTTATVTPHVREADVVHLHGMWTLSNLPYARAARRLSVPYVFSPHGMLDDWCMGQKTLKKKLFLAAVGRRLLERAEAVHCTAPGELEQSQQWFPGGRGVVAPLALDTAPYRNLPGPELARGRFPLRAGMPLVLFLSRVHPKKGVERVVHVAAALKKRGLDVDTAIAGTGERTYVNALRRLTEELGVADRVHFLGLVLGDAKVSLYQAADVFLLPTSQENFAFVLFEALAAGTPVVTTRGVDTWPDLQASGGAVITDGSSECMATEVVQLLGSPTRRSAMATAGRDWVLTAQEPLVLASRYESIYRPASPRT